MLEKVQKDDRYHEEDLQKDMRILITGQTYYPAYNGEATFMVHLAEGLAQRGHDILVAIPAMSNMPPVSQRNGVKIHWVNSIPLNFLHPDTAYSLFPEREITGLLEKFRPQIVHIQDHYPISKAAAQGARRTEGRAGTDDC